MPMTSRQRHHYTVVEATTTWPGTDITTRRLVVKKRSGRDGITWDVLQAIKNEVLGPDAVAVEVFPADANLVYHVNARHLWEVPPGVEVPCLARRWR